MIPPNYVGKALRVLDFDCESRPLSYLGADYTTAEITAIAAGFSRRQIEVWALGEYTVGEMLNRFLPMWHEAELVTGHNILRHDLPRLNAMLLEWGMSPLGPKMVSDTYVHLKRRQGVSASQESLAQMLGVKAPKIAMSQKDWRDANRLLPEGVIATKKRVRGDVIQHMELRKELVELGWLKAPRRWSA